MSAQSTPPSKRLCVFSDGTWNTADVDPSALTNITTLARSLRHKSADGVQQICFYDPGLGTEGDGLARLRGGAFGAGIDLNIQQLYTFLAMNYDQGDEIYMFGFSRGAYTVRSLAGMIHESGLVYREKLDYVQEAYALYRDNEDVDSSDAVQFREKHSRRVPIKLLACFDTVGSLGFPDGLPFPLSLFSDDHRYRFHNTLLSDIIENAIHVLSIDEDRKSFAPTYMTANAARGATQVTEKFMPGSHGGVGGGNSEEKQLANNALLFILQEMSNRALGIEFGGDLLPEAYTYDIQPLAARGVFDRHNLIKMVSGGEHIRQISSIDRLHETAVRRFNMVSAWRPKALKPLEQILLRVVDTL